MTRKKLLLGSAALFMGVSQFAIPASADVYVYVDVYKDVDIYVYENIYKDKDVDVDVNTNFDLFSAAESEAVVNQVNEWNPVITSVDPTFFLGIDLDAVVTNSVNLNSGISQLNVDVGNMVNQGNVVSVAGTDASAGPAFTHAESSAEQRNNNNMVTGIGRLDVLNPDRNVAVTDSISGNNGITEVNVNAGDMSNQLNSVAISIGFDSDVALTEADLGQHNAFNTVDETNTVKSNVVTDSVNNNIGVTLVNTNTGNMNNQATVVSFAGVVAF